MRHTVAELAEQLQGEVLGDRQWEIHGAQAVHHAGSHDITFMTASRKIQELPQCRAGAVLVGKEFANSIPADSGPPAVILVADARSAFIRVMQRYRPQRPRTTIGVSPQAVVAASAQIGEDTNIHPGARIADSVVIGNRCEIYSGVYIGANCRIGDDVTLYPNVVLYPEVLVGDRVMIHAGAVLGADGFGYQFEGGRFVKIPQLGTVTIENDVEIGACTTIDRGMIGPTLIGEGTKIDNLVMIGHNCELGKHNVMVAQVGLAGSVTTGDYVRCAGQAGVADHLHLGSGCTVAAKSGVYKDVPAGETQLGIPARSREEHMPALIAQTKLPEMRKHLKQLKTQVDKLTEQLATLTSAQPPAPGNTRRRAG